MPKSFTIFHCIFEKHFVLCANTSICNKNHEEKFNKLEERTVADFSSTGGFFAIFTEKDSIRLTDAFRYGNKSEMNNQDWLESSAFIPFMASDSSCTLKIPGKNEDFNLYYYEITAPTPGN